MSEQKEQSWCHCSLSGVEPTCGKPMVDDGTDFCENMLPDGTYCAHGHACHSLSDQAEPEPTNWQAHAEALAEAAKQAYLLLLKIRSEDRYTLDYQYTLCVLRDQIAEYEGRSAEDVQNDYESQALAAYDQDRGRVK